MPAKEMPDQEARKLVFGARAQTYGHPRYDFAIIAGMWAAMLRGRVHFTTKPDAKASEINWNEVITPEIIALMMTAFKLARLMKTPDHWDSRVDVHGYMDTLDRVLEPEDDE